MVFVMSTVSAGGIDQLLRFFFSIWFSRMAAYILGPGSLCHGGGPISTEMCHCSHTREPAATWFLLFLSSTILSFSSFLPSLLLEGVISLDAEPTGQNLTIALSQRRKLLSAYK